MTHTFSPKYREDAQKALAATKPFAPWCAPVTEEELWKFVERIAQGNPLPRTDASKLLAQRHAWRDWNARREAAQAALRSHWTQGPGNMVKSCECPQCVALLQELAVTVDESVNNR